MVKWNLWLDDERDPNKMLIQSHAERYPEFQEYLNRGFKASDFMWAVGVEAAKLLVEAFGPPSFIAFDHDLVSDTAMTFIRWLADKHFDARIEYAVHSANPEGKKNIISLMETWKNAQKGY